MATAGARKSGLSLRAREARAGYLCILPWLVGFLVFTLGPTLASLYFSLNEYRLVKPPVFIGVENYESMLDDDPLWQSVRVTLTYVLFAMPLHLVFAFAVALLLNQPIRFVALA